jgi:hypothetical protein
MLQTLRSTAFGNTAQVMLALPAQGLMLHQK